MGRGQPDVGTGRRYAYSGNADDARADRSAEQHRFSQCCLDPAGQHHDGGANHRAGHSISGRAEAACGRAGSRCQCAGRPASAYDRVQCTSCNASAGGKEAGGRQRVCLGPKAACDHATGRHGRCEAAAGSRTTASSGRRRPVRLRQDVT